MSPLTRFRLVPSMCVVISVSIGFVNAKSGCYPFSYCDSRQDYAIRIWKITNEQDLDDNEPEWPWVVAVIFTFLVCVSCGVALFHMQICCPCCKSQTEETGILETETPTNWMRAEVRATARSNLNDPPPSYGNVNMGYFPSAPPALIDDLKNVIEDPPSYNEVMGSTITHISFNTNGMTT